MDGQYDENAVPSGRAVTLGHLLSCRMEELARALRENGVPPIPLLGQGEGGAFHYAVVADAGPRRVIVDWKDFRRGISLTRDELFEFVCILLSASATIDG